jgi:Type II secretion system (T2SS), protein E, N-terminal domain
MAFAAHNQERDLPLGELIVRAGLLSSVQLDAALAAARASGRRLGEVLVEDELVDERELAQIVAQQEGLEFVDLGKHDLDHEAVDLLSESSARRYLALPYRLEGTAVCVVIADPSDDAALDVVLGEVERPVRFVVATRTEVEAALREAFGEPFTAA